MRQAVVPVKIDNTDAIDVCGTGGDGLQTVNISMQCLLHHQLDAVLQNMGIDQVWQEDADLD